VSPGAFLNDDYISANFVIINAFPKMGQISQTTKLHEATNLYISLNESDS